MDSFWRIHLFALCFLTLFLGDHWKNLQSFGPFGRKCWLLHSGHLETKSRAGKCCLFSCDQLQLSKAKSQLWQILSGHSIDNATREVTCARRNAPLAVKRFRVVLLAWGIRKLADGHVVLLLVVCVWNLLRRYLSYNKHPVDNDVTQTKQGFFLDTPGSFASRLWITETGYGAILSQVLSSSCIPMSWCGHRVQNKILKIWNVVVEYHWVAWHIREYQYGYCGMSWTIHPNYKLIDFRMAKISRNLSVSDLILPEQGWKSLAQWHIAVETHAAAPNSPHMHMAPPTKGDETCGIAAVDRTGTKTSHQRQQIIWRLFEALNESWQCCHATS